MIPKSTYCYSLICKALHSLKEWLGIWWYLQKVEFLRCCLYLFLCLGQRGEIKLAWRRLDKILSCCNVILKWDDMDSLDNREGNVDKGRGWKPSIGKIVIDVKRMSRKVVVMQATIAHKTSFYAIGVSNRFIVFTCWSCRQQSSSRFPRGNNYLVHVHPRVPCCVHVQGRDPTG